MDVADAFTTEYGEGPGGIRAGKQDAYFAGGNKYILENFPHLDYIKTAKVISSGTGQEAGIRHWALAEPAEPVEPKTGTERTSSSSP